MELVVTNLDDTIGTITFNHPTKRNSIGLRFADDFVRHEAQTGHGVQTPAAGRRAASLSP